MAGAVGPTGLPKIQLMPTRISVMPITAIMVPVTTGGKAQHAADGGRDQDGHHARADDGAEQQLRAAGPGSAVAMAAMGATEAKVTPIMTGSWMPNQRVAPSVWISVISPQQNRSAEISMATSRR